jgi:hypothetical protein
MQVKHSKFKNTGILFELLVRQITSDTMSGKDSPASKFLKKYFVNTELGKEYKLYDTLIKNQSINESKANVVIESVLASSKKLKRSNLRREKYNLIKEIREHYNVDDLFRTKINNYKQLASLYILMELYNSKEIINPKQIVSNKVTLLEYLTTKPQDEGVVKQTVIQEFKKYDKDLRILTYRTLLEKFNTKYTDFNNDQKSILKNFIESIDSTSKLKEFFNSKIQEAKVRIDNYSKTVKSEPIKIKLQEVKKYLKEKDKRHKIKNDDLVDLLHYYELIGELNKVN